jgi:acetyl esterase/lipase
VPFGDIVKAQNGDLCVVAYSPQGPWEKYEERRFRSWLFRSKDDGKSWGEPVVLGPDANETNIVHLGEGRWLACARGGTGVEKRDFMELYGSSDDGRTWKKKRTLAGFQRVNGHLLQLKDGRVLFTYGDRASDNGKKGLEAMISSDRGETWSSAVRLADWNGLDGGYPSCVQRADGQIVTAYYSSALPGEPPDSMKGYHMAVIVWDADKSFAKVKGTLATSVDVAYGSHPRQTMDIWLPESDKPAPVVFYIHGGGWNAHEKTDIHDHLDVSAFLKAGIAVISIDYRLLKDANAANIFPPVQWSLEDAARALQFVRSKSAEWHLDKNRIAGTGVSAGGCSSLWLAFHDDMADPRSSDPIARESTRLDCAAVKAPVVSLDPKQLREWIPNAIFGAHAFGYADLSRAASFEPFFAARETHLADIRRFSPYELVSKDDPPVFVEFPNQDKPPVPGEKQTDPTHTAISGLMLERKLQSVGVPVEFRYKNDGKTGNTNVQQYLLRRFSQPSPARP